MATNNKAVCYCRVSTEEQATEGISLEAQEARLEAYCASNNLQVVEMVMEPGVSASKPLARRPGGARVLELVHKKEVAHVVALKLDRCFRSASDALEHSSAWDRQDVGLHLVDLGGQSVNTRSALGKFYFLLLAGLAELERNMVSERTTAALAYMKSQKKIYGPTPLGFQRNCVKLVEDKEELAVVRQIRSQRQQGWSLQKIADGLNLNGTRTKKGKKWHHTTINRIVRNSLYQEA